MTDDFIYNVGLQFRSTHVATIRAQLCALLQTRLLRQICVCCLTSFFVLGSRSIYTQSLYELFASIMLKYDPYINTKMFLLFMLC